MCINQSNKKTDNYSTISLPARSTTAGISWMIASATTLSKRWLITAAKINWLPSSNPWGKSQCSSAKMLMAPDRCRNSSKSSKWKNIMPSSKTSSNTELRKWAKTSTATTSSKRSYNAGIIHKTNSSMMRWKPSASKLPATSTAAASCRNA